MAAALAPALRTGYVYKLACLDPAVAEIYVGSTTRVADRRQNHKSRCNNAAGKYYNLVVYQFIRANGGWANWSLLVVEQIEYTLKHQLLLRERHHLEDLGATLNRQVPGAMEVGRQAYDAVYHLANRDAILARNNIKHNCSCGGRYTHINMIQHSRSKRHIAYEAAAAAAVAVEVAA